MLQLLGSIEKDPDTGAHLKSLLRWIIHTQKTTVGLHYLTSKTKLTESKVFIALDELDRKYADKIRVVLTLDETLRLEEI